MTPDPDTLVMLSREGKEPACEVCVDQRCAPMRATLRKTANASVEFGCPRPQELYQVEVNQDIGRTTRFYHLLYLWICLHIYFPRNYF